MLVQRSWALTAAESHIQDKETKEKKRGKLKDGGIFSQGAMRATAEISTHLQVDLRLIHHEKQPGKHPSNDLPEKSKTPCGSAENKLKMSGPPC